MSDFHKSKEVYRYTPTANGDKLVPVRGLYVSGLHKEPWYIDHAVTVTGFTSNDGTIVHYTNKRASLQPDHLMNMTNVSSSDVTLAVYSSKSAKLQPDHLMNFIDVSTNTASVYSYTSKREYLQPDHLMNFIDVGVTGVSFTRYNTNRQPQNPQPTIVMTQFTSTAGTISAQ